MLDPDYLERAGDMVAAVYGEIEAEMTACLARLLLDQDLDELGQRGQTAVNLLAQSAAPKLMAILEKARPDVSRAVAETVEDALRRSDAADARRLGGKLPEGAASSLPRQMELTARGIAEILERDNVEMTTAALDLWNRCVTEAVAKANSGALTAEQAVHAAVRRMMREGCSWVQYRDSKTGRQTVANRVDVAVRRHVRTQLHQDGMRRTLGICEEAGVRLVEVSSHGGARPEHARWQGRVYSLDGDVTIGGVRYRDFYRETGYGKVDGLGGANCRHDFAPWIPGTPRMHEPDPPHPSGLPNDEVYRLAQGQRRRERGIRDAKRELAAAQLIADKDPSLANVAEVERAKAKLRGRQEGMRDYIAETNAKGDAPVLRRAPAREWAGDMPKVRKSDASRRSMGEFLDGAGVKRTLKARGMTKAEARAALTEELKFRNIDPKNWRNLSMANQQSVFKKALDSLKPAPRKASGKHMRNAATFEAKLAGKGLDQTHISAIASIADKCTDKNAKRAFDAALADLKFDDLRAGARTAYYNPRTQGITLDIETTAKGYAARSDKAAYQTFFHEYGHYIDHRNGRDYDYASQLAGLGAIAKKEVQARLRDIKKSEGYGSIYDAKEHLTKEILSLYRRAPQLIGGLSDIIHGATGGTCCDYGLPAHPKSYWKGKWGMHSLSTETFAHFFECQMTNPDALETLKRYLPNTYDAYIEMMKGL